MHQMLTHDEVHQKEERSLAPLVDQRPFNATSSFTIDRLRGAASCSNGEIHLLGKLLSLGCVFCRGEWMDEMWRIVCMPCQTMDVDGDVVKLHKGLMILAAMEYSVKSIIECTNRPMMIA